jgi:DNA helicase-2/ATP-dependent DNA helicase PcrA
MNALPEILDDLNPRQKQAVSAGEGQVLVLAGPGSGKTRVLTRRIAYLITRAGVNPYHIIAMTFTNKAAREMEKRLVTVLPGQVEGIWLGTFHGNCARILRREIQHLPLKSDFVIFDADDQISLVKRAERDLNVDDKVFRPVSVHAAISAAKNDLKLPADITTRHYREEVIARVYQRYQELLTANNAVDFDDLLFYAVRLMDENSEIGRRYAERFQHVLVDEFQDTNTAQYRLLRHLASCHQNLFAVGDEDQSIYRWRGADYRNILRFEEDFPQCQKILLEQNYRSTQNVLDAARQVIDRNANRTRKNLFSENGAGDKIELFEAADDHAEAAYVVDAIQNLVKARKAGASEFAIMYRTNSQSRLLEEAFLTNGMPYRLVGAQRFYGRREVKDLICFLRLVQNPQDEVSLQRVINVPPRGIGDKTLLNLQTIALQSRLTPGEILLDLGENGGQSIYASAIGRSVASMIDFGALLVGWREAHLGGLPLPKLFERILDETVYHEFIDDGSEEGAGRWDNVMELRRITFEYQERGLGEFLENLALISDQDTLPEQMDAPTLLTLHAAKGLEFPRVFIVGLDEGLLPHSRSRDDPEEMAEERRLFYVGMTRAKKNLYLVRADRRSTYGSYEEAIPSRFILDIPDTILQTLGSRTGRSAFSRLERPNRKENYLWDSLPAYGGKIERKPSSPPRPVVMQRFPPNTRVRHAVWGEGLVIDSRLQDNDETLVVAFDSVGVKRLAASLANLEIIG